MVNSVSFSVKPVLPPGVSTTTTVNSTSGLSPQQQHQHQQQQHYLQQRQQQQQHQQQQQQQQQYRYSSSQQQQQQQYQQQQHTLYSPQPKLPLSSSRQEHPTHSNNQLQGSRPQSPAPQPPLHHSSQSLQQQQQHSSQQQQHTTQQHHAQHPAQDHPSSHRPHSPSQQQQQQQQQQHHPSTTMHTSDNNNNNNSNNSHGQGFDPQSRLKPYNFGPPSHTDHWPQHHPHHNHHNQPQHRSSHDSGEPYSNNNNQPSGSSNGHLNHSRNDLPADEDNTNNSTHNNMIHLPVKKEPDSEQGHNRLDLVHKGSKRHLEYRERNNVESLDEGRVDQHMEDPDSERYQQQHQRQHDQPSSSSSSAGYYPQDHHLHRGPPSGGDPAGYHSSGSYQDSMYHHQQQPQPNQQQHHPGGRPHSLSARPLPSLLPRPMDASDGRPGESSRGHPRDEQASYGWDDMRHRPPPPPGGRPTIHTDMGSPHYGGHRSNQPPLSAGPHSASIHSSSQLTAPVSAPVSAAAAPTPTTPVANSAPAVAATSSSSSSAVSASSSSSASSAAVLVPAPPGSVVVNNGSSKKRTTPAKHKCPECDKYFTRPFNLKSHQRTHTQERPFVCSFAHCARAFSRLHDCNRHMRTHWRIKPYSCPECHRNFVRQDALTRHLRLDFGHNRCSGYPGPLPGNADQGDKDGDDEEEDMMEDDEDFPDPEAEDQNTGNETKPASKSSTSSAATAGAKGVPSPVLPSPTSPTAVSNKAKATSTTGASEQERERPLTISTAAANAGQVSTVAASGASATKEAHPAPRTSDSTSKFDKEDQERSPHARHSLSTTPMSVVHLADRPVAPSEGSKEVSGQPHARSYSHSAYNYGPSTPLTIQTGNMPMRPTKHLERRATAPVVREGESWMGHAQGQGYAQEPVSSPVDEYPRGGPGYGGGYRHEMDRPRSATHLPPDYPTSPKDIRRSPGPQSAQAEWHPRSGPPSAHWGWSNPPPSSQDARLRHPTWSSSSLPPHPQDPSLMQPPHSPVEWSRGHPPPSPHDDPRKSSIRSMSRYGSSPYPIPEHGSGGVERHHRGSSGPMSPAGPMRSSDPYRRSTATAEMDRVGSWNEQRSRSFHGAEGMQDPRSRYESAGSNLPPASSTMSTGRSPLAAETAASSSLVSERSHSVSGMVGVERMYPATSVGGGSFHEREHPSGSIPPPIKTSGDPNGRDYRPTRSQSMMDYDAAAMRRSRYPGDPKMVLREERRSISPPGHRVPIIDTSRSYEGVGPRYPYSAGAERPPGPVMEGGKYPSREEVDEMQARRRDEGGVGYYDEHGPRSATFPRAHHGY